MGIILISGGAGGGGGVRIEDWSTPILSSLSPDEFNSVSASDLVDQWSQLGVDDPLKTLKRLQVCSTLTLTSF